MLDTSKNNWTQKKINEVITKVSLTGRKLPQSRYQPIGKYPVIDQGQKFIGGYSDEELSVNCELPIIVFGDHTKIIKYIDFPFIAGADGVRVIKPSNEFVPKLFYYFLHAIDLPNKGYARHFQFLEQATISIPSIPEQKRIVAKIEELFSQLDAGTAGLRRVQAGLKKYRASVLKAAFEGRLVGQQETSENVTDLLLMTLGKDYHGLIEPSDSNKLEGTPNGWVFGRLEHLIYIAGRIGWRGLKADEYTPEGPLFLSVYNLNKGDLVDFSEVNHISMERYLESPEIMLQENDILLAKDGAGIGKIGYVKNLPNLATVNSSLLVIRASEIFDPKFLFYLLKGPEMQRIVRMRITGSATPHLFQRDIKKFTLLIPPISEQRLIVEEIERRLSFLAELEQIISTIIVRSKHLRQSILKNAFSGKLVT